MTDLFKEKWVEAFFNKILMLHYHFRLPFNALVAGFLMSKLMLFPTTKHPYSNSSSNGISWYKDVAVNTELLQWGVAAGNVGHGTMLQGSAGWSMVGKSKGQTQESSLPAPVLDLATAISFQPYFLLCPNHPPASQFPVPQYIGLAFLTSVCVCTYIHKKHWTKCVLQRRGWEMEQWHMEKQWGTNNIYQDIFDITDPCLM